MSDPLIRSDPPHLRVIRQLPPEGAKVGVDFAEIPLLQNEFQGIHGGHNDLSAPTESKGDSVAVELAVVGVNGDVDTGVVRVWVLQLG